MSHYVATCVKCGKEIRTQTAEATCPRCGLAVRLEWPAKPEEKK